MNKILLVAGVALVAAAFFLHTQTTQAPTTDYLAQFNQFKQTYNKKYSSAEDTYRLAVFTANTMEAELHNADPTQTWQMGTTQFSDLTQEEFASIYLTYRPEEAQDLSLAVYEDNDFVPSNDVDWSGQSGVSTKVKNQGGCGSCWAFSAVSAAEAYFATVKGQKGLDLSEQQLVDCSKANYGCNGGWPDKALSWVAANGLTTQSAYPYAGRDQTCKTSTGAYKISSVQKVTASAASLQSAINQRPVSVCVDASKWSQYSSGVMSSCGTSRNHAVTAFGYTSSYWKIKNSWGTGWGESGYIRLAMGDTCGVTKEAVLAA